jgi:hypothetical protein
MHTDPTASQAHEVGHARALEATAPRNPVDSALGVHNSESALGVIDHAIGVGIFVGHLFGNSERALGRLEVVDPRRNVSPTYALRAIVELGSLRKGVDLDARDGTSTTFPLV